MNIVYLTTGGKVSDILANIIDVNILNLRNYSTLILVFLILQTKHLQSTFTDIKELYKIYYYNIIVTVVRSMEYTRNPKVQKLSFLERVNI